MKEIDINNEEEILKECNFDYFYNCDDCSRELCMFYNDILKQKEPEFDKRQALIDLMRIAITINKKTKRIVEMGVEIDKLETQSIIDVDHIDYHQNEYLRVKDQVKEKDEKISLLKQELSDKESKWAKFSVEFSIEQLKKVKCELVNNVSPVKLSYNDYVQKVFEKINNQINILKKEN